MSPASYLTAPPRVAAASIASIAAMSAWTWAALAFFLVVLVGGSAVVGWMGLRLWRRVRAAMDASSEVVEELSAEMEALDGRLRRVEGTGAELQGATASLSATLARARILLGAAQESRDAIAGWLRFVPRT